MTISFLIAALVFVGNDDKQPERPAGSASIVPTPCFACEADCAAPALLVARSTDQLNDARPPVADSA
jgi:hypothetical protein